MALPTFAFDPATGLMSIDDFPTQPESENAARYQIQSLLNQIAGGVNALKTALENAETGSGASLIGSEPIKDTAGTVLVAGETVREQIADLKTQMAGIVSAGVGTGDVTEEKIASNAVTEEKIKDGEVSYAKLGSDTKPTTADIAYYVDAANGNDSTGDGSSGAPYKTVPKVLTVMNKNIGRGYTTTIYFKGNAVVVTSISEINGGGTLHITRWPSASAYYISGINIFGNTADIVITNLQIASHVDIGRSTARITSCTIHSGAIAYAGANLMVDGCTFNTSSSAMIYALPGSSVFSASNSGVGSYGLYASGGIIIKGDATQPTGTVANELTEYGGQILS
jgi:hypothetical protein